MFYYITLCYTLNIIFIEFHYLQNRKFCSIYIVYKIKIKIISQSYLFAHIIVYSILIVKFSRDLFVSYLMDENDNINIYYIFKMTFQIILILKQTNISM